MEVGIVGKPNVGKSTFFNALTLLDVPMAPYPFTTVRPNRGVGAVRTPCPHVEKSTPCQPGNAACRNGTRWVPVSLVDVPGLVPGAHAGKGLGLQFLDDLRAADGFVQVVDASGATAQDGSITSSGSSDPADDVGWLEEELDRWVAGILARDFGRHAKTVELEGAKVDEFLAARLTGLAIAPATIASALRHVPLDRTQPSHWTETERLELVRSLLREAKPRLVAANKADRSSPESVAKLTQAVAPLPVRATCAEAELTLRRAARLGLVEYAPGSQTFSLDNPSKLSSAQQHALEEVRVILGRWGTTGVQEALEAMVFERLHRIVVFPVEDEVHWTDSKGRVLPDALLLPLGTAARTMAYKVHSDLGENFIRAIDGRSHRALAAETPLEHGAVVRIVARR